jgi:ABC-2 type transport system ATP-binding protein
MSTAVRTGVSRSGPPRAGSRAIEARDLVKTYPGGVRALDGLSIAVETGAIFGLLGPNGAGKSTTVKILTTLARPDAGGAHVGGLDVRRQPDQVRRVIGCVAQKSGVDKEATGRENLTLQGHFHGMGGPDLKRRVDELLARFGLAEAARRVARTYSGGMQRKLDIAMGLVHRPKVLFLDEPTTGLDPEARADLWAEIGRLSGEEGLTILLTTHYLEEADRLARRLAIVDRGRIVVEGSPEELKGELRGDAVHIGLDRLEADARVRAALDRVGGVREVALHGMELRARVDNGATALPGVLAALDAAGVRVASASVARPSLDDVYLRHTGRVYSSRTPPPDRSGTAVGPTTAPGLKRHGGEAPR